MFYLDDETDSIMAPTGLSFLSAPRKTQAERQAQRQANIAQRKVNMEQRKTERQADILARKDAQEKKQKERMTQAEANKQLRLNKAVQDKINAEIRQVQKQIDRAKKANADVPEWVTYLECLKLRLTDAAKTCTKPTGTIAQAIAKVKTAKKAAGRDVQQITASDNAAVSQISSQVAKMKQRIKERVTRLAASKNANDRAKAVKLATKYCLLINPQGGVSGDVCMPSAISSKAASAAARGKSRRRSLKGMGEDDGVSGDSIGLDPFGPEIGGNITTPTSTSTTVADAGINNGDLGITQLGGEDMDCGVILLALGGDAPVDPKCAKRPNKPACMMARMQEEQKKQFAILILFLCEMINDLKMSITNVPVYDPATDQSNVPIYDPYIDSGGGMVLGPTEDFGLIDTSAPVGEEGGGAMEMVTGPMPNDMVDDAVSFDGAGSEFDNRWMQDGGGRESIPSVAVPSEDFGGGVDEIGISEGFIDEGFGDEGFADDTLDFGDSAAGLFGLNWDGDVLCDKCARKK